MRTSDKNKLTNQILLGLLAASIGLGGMEYVSAAPDTPPAQGDTGSPTNPVSDPTTETTTRVVSTKTEDVFIENVVSERDTTLSKAPKSDQYGKNLEHPELNNMPLDVKGTVNSKDGTVTIGDVITKVTEKTTTPRMQTVTTTVTETVDASDNVVGTDTIITKSDPFLDHSKDEVKYTVKDGRDTNALNVYQTSSRAIIQWDSFNVGSNSTVNFIQTKDGALNTGAMTLNEVTGNNLSTIAGKINSIGTFILTNPNGIYFTEGSAVNAAGIIASTNALDHDRFMNNGELRFNQDDNTDNQKNKGIIVNGSLHVASLAESELKNDAGVLTTLGQEISGILKSTAINTDGLSLATGLAAGTNTIKIVANGDIAIGKSGKLVGDRVTRVSKTGGTAGTEGYTIGGGTGEKREATIVLRADANADDVAEYDPELLIAGGVTDPSAIKRYNEMSVRSSDKSKNIPVETNIENGKYKTAKVYLQNEKKMTANGVSIFFNADITDAGVNGTALSSIGVTNAGQEKFTQKNYKTGAQEAADMAKYVDVHADQTYNENGKLKVDANGNVVKSKGYGNHNTNFAMLINDPYQLQAIEDTKEVYQTETGDYTPKTDENAYYGNLDASYALGQTLYNTEYKVFDEDVNANSNKEAVKNPSFKTINTYKMADWNAKKGFNPIGDETNVFTGSFTGNGLMGYGIYDLTINRPDTDDVGLFAHTKAKKDAAGNYTANYFGSVMLVDSHIVGKDDVGALIGHADEGTSMGGITSRKRHVRYTEDFRSVNELLDKDTGKEVNVKGEKNVGGLVGQMKDARMYDNSHNQGYVVGKENVDGLAGVATGETDTSKKNSNNTTTATTNYIRNSYNSGWISNEMSLGTAEEYDFATPDHGSLKGYGKVITGSNVIDGVDYGKKENIGTGKNREYKVGVVEGEKNVGGLVGNLSGTTRIENQVNDQSDVYNSGSVQGTENVGGLVGQMEGSAEMSRVFNTNERSNADGTKVGTTPGYANNAAMILTDETQAKDGSVYGRVTGVEHKADDGTVKTSSSVGGLVGTMSGGTISNAYNAGDVQGAENVGGLVGTMTGGTIEKAYNADNNTILMTKEGANGSHRTAEDRQAEGEYVGFEVKKGVDSSTDPSEKNINGVYTYDVINATWTRKTANGKTVTGIATDNLPDGNLRINNNRMAYRDATVTGEKNVGGLIGSMTNGTVNQAYSEGKVTGTEKDTTGGIVGSYTNGTLGKDDKSKVFFAKSNEATGEALVNQNEKIDVVGSASTGTKPGNAEALTMQGLTQSGNIGWDDGKGKNEKDNHSVMDNDYAQNSDWIAYNNQTAPLLKTFMTFIKIKRQYQYDGTVHNLITSDVSNYYGGAFFASTGADGKERGTGYGKNVFSPDVPVVDKTDTEGWQIATGSADANREKSSQYHYDKSDLWSPQHGYYTDPDASVIITPEPVKIKIENVTKTYGQLTKGYVYRYDETDADGNVTNSTYYSYDKADGWTKLDEAPTQGTTYIITLTHTEKNKEGKYETVNGLANENNDKVNPTTQLKELAFLKAEILDGENVTGTTKGATDLSVTPDDDLANRKQKPNSSYTLNLTGVADGKDIDDYRKEEHYNYLIDFSKETEKDETKPRTEAILNVLKPTLYFTAKGERDYGSDTTMGTLDLMVKISSVRKGSENAFDNGCVNPWDIEGVKDEDITVNSDGTYTVNFHGVDPKKIIKDDQGNVVGLYLSALKSDIYTGPKADKDIVPILAKEPAWNGIQEGGKPVSTDHPAIDAKTWVNTNDAAHKDGKNKTSYTIAKNSFMQLDKDGNLVKDADGKYINIFQSDEYNIVYTGNKDDAADAEFGTYLIKPIELIYNVTGYHTYGEKPNKDNPAYEMAANPGYLLKNGDKITDVVDAGNARDLVKQIFDDNAINENTHVTRDKDGKVAPYLDRGLIYGDGVKDGQHSTANALTSNYILKSGKLYYRIDPAKAVYKVNDNKKTYGATELAPDSGTLELYKGTEAAAEDGTVTATYHVDDKGNVTLDADRTKTVSTNVTTDEADNTASDGSLTHSLYQGGAKANNLKATFTHAQVDDNGTKKDLDDPTLGVKYQADGETIDSYKGVISAKGLYLNDYDITYKTGDFTVNRKDLYVKAGDATKTYGDENTDANVVAFTDVTFDGLTEGDKGTLGGKAGQKYFDSTLTEAAKNGDKAIKEDTNAGTTLDDATEIVDKNAKSKAQSAYKNYNINPEKGKETVIKRGLSFTFDSNNAKTTYGQTPKFTGKFDNFAGVTSEADQKALAEAFANGGNKNYDVPEQKFADGTKKDLPQYDVGTYTVGANADKLKEAIANWNPNYELNVTKNEPGTWTVNKAKLNITAEGARSYGEENALGQLTFQASHNNSGKDDDGVDNGALKSWDAARIAGDISKLDGYTVDTSKGVSLLSKDEAKNGITTDGKEVTTSKAIDAKTWVKTDAAGNVIAYDLSGASLAGVFSSKNYDIEFTGGTYQVNPADLTYDVTGSHVYGSDPVYGTGAHTYQAAADATQLKNGDALENVVSADQVQAFSANVLSANDINKRTHVHRNADGEVIAPKHPTTATATLTPNYTLKLGKLTYTVTPADLTVTAGGAKKTYGEAAFQAENLGAVTFDDGFQNGDEARLSAYYKTQADASIDAKTDAGTHVGMTHAVVAEEDADKFSDYNVKTVDGDVVIDRAKLAVTAGDATKTYGEGKLQNAGLTYDGFQNDDENALSGYYTAESDSAYAKTDKAAGTYAGENKVTLQTDADDKFKNYDVTTKDGNVIIDKAPLSVVAGDATRTYGDADFKNGTIGAITIDGFKNGEGAALEKYYTTQVDASITAETDAGTYAKKTRVVPLEDLSDEDKASIANYRIAAHVDGTVTIEKAPLTLKAGDATKTYGDAFQQENIGAVTIEGFKNNDKEKLGKYYTTQVDASVDAKAHVGTYAGKTSAKLTADGEGKFENYYIQEETTGTATITPAELVIQAGDATKTYGDAFQNKNIGAVTFEGFKNHDEDTLAKYYTTQVDASLDAKAGVGTYAGKTTAELLKDGIGKFSDYTIKEMRTGTATITPATLTVTAGDATKTYGEAALQNAGIIAYDGFKNDDAAALSGYYIAVPDSIYLQKETDAGTYAGGNRATIQDGDKAYFKNYNVEAKDGNVIIRRAPLSILAGDATKTYGDTSFLTTPVTFDGFQNRDADTLAKYYTTRADDALTQAGADAGSYAGKTQAFIEEGDKDQFKNYDIVNATRGTAVITPADLTVTAGNGTKDEGEENSTFVFTPVTFDGFHTSRDLETLGSTTAATTYFQTGLWKDSLIDAKTPEGTYAGETVASYVGGTDLYKNYRLQYQPGDVIIQNASPMHDPAQQRVITGVTGSVTGGNGTNNLLPTTPTSGTELLPQESESTGTTTVPAAIDGTSSNGSSNSDAGTPSPESGSGTTNGTTNGSSSSSNPSSSEAGSSNGGASNGSMGARSSETGNAATGGSSSSGTTEANGTTTSSNTEQRTTEVDGASKESSSDDRKATYQEETDGGNKWQDGLRSLRFLTLEDTVIRVSDVVADLGDLVIDASSRTDGGDTVILKQEGLDLSIYGTRPILDGTTVDTAATDLVLHGEETPAAQGEEEVAEVEG